MTGARRLPWHPVVCLLIVAHGPVRAGQLIARPFDADDPAWRDAFAQDTGRQVHFLDPPANWYVKGECTWFVRAVRNDDPFPVPPGEGNAWRWFAHFAGARYGMGHVPKCGSIAVWRTTVGGGHGHVALVTKVMSNTRFEVWDSNWGADPRDHRVRHREVTDIDGIRGFIYWPHGRTEPYLSVLSTAPQNGARSVSPQAPLVIEFDQAVDPQGVTAGVSIARASALMDVLEGAGLPVPTPAAHWTAEGNVLRCTDWYSQGYAHYQVTLNRELKSRCGASLAEPFELRFSVAGQETETPLDADISGRWEGQCHWEGGGRRGRYRDKVAILEADGRVFWVCRREDLDTGGYIVWAADDTRSAFLGSGRVTAQDKARMDSQIIERRGAWQWTDRYHRELSGAGDVIQFREELDEVFGTRVQRGSWTRTAPLRPVSRLTSVLLRSHGMARLGEEADGGELVLRQASRYLLVLLNYPGSKLELVAIRPDGTRVRPSDAGVTYIADEIPARLYIRSPSCGLWQFRVRGLEVEGDTEPFWVLASSTDVGPAGETANRVGGVISPSVDWQNGALFAVLAAILVLTGLCVAVVIRQRSGRSAVHSRRVLALLRVRERGGTERTLRLAAGAVRLGRSTDNDVVLRDPKVSARHAVLRVGRGEVRIEDLGSTNGTWVNDTRVTAAVLRNGDRIELGETTLTYVLPR